MLLVAVRPTPFDGNGVPEVCTCLSYRQIASSLNLHMSTVRISMKILVQCKVYKGSQEIVISTNATSLKLSVISVYATRIATVTPYLFV